MRKILYIISVLVTFSLCANAQEYHEWSGNIPYTIIDSGTHNIKLVGDCFMSENDLYIYITGSATKVTVDLNGFVFKKNHYNCLFVVLNGATLTIKDSRPDIPHYGIPRKDLTVRGYHVECLWDYDPSYTADTPGAIELDGGIICGGMGTMFGGIRIEGDSNNPKKVCNSTVNLEGGTIAGNSVGPKYNGHYIWTETEMDSLDANEFQKQGSAAGVFVADGCVFNMSGGRICYNNAGICGSGVYVAGTFNMSGGSIDHNTLLAYHGAGVFLNNAAQNVGYHPEHFGRTETSQFIEGGIMTMTGGSISHNSTHGGSGGGIMAWMGSNLTIRKGTSLPDISYNRADGYTTSGFGNGGGIYGERATMYITGIDLHHNFSRRYGGGLYFFIANTTLDMFGADGATCNIHDNSGACGGGLCTSADLISVSLGDGVFINNNHAYHDGGGVFMMGGTLTVDGAQITNNEAENNGGGVAMRINDAPELIYNIDLEFKSGSISGNKAGTSNRVYTAASDHNDPYLPGWKQTGTATYDRSGGGISIVTTPGKNSSGEQQTRQCSVNLTGGTLADNSCTLNDSSNQNGGGLFVKIGPHTTTELKFIGASGNPILIDNNSAKTDGGGVYISSGTVTVENANITNCTALHNGGGICVTGGSLTARSSIISANTATLDGGAGYVSGGNLELSDSKANGNKSLTGNGGGFFVNGGFTFTNGDVLGNTSAANGGGAYVSGGTVSFFGNLSSNKAKNGGGLYLSSGADMTFKGGIISGNIAEAKVADISKSAFYGRDKTKPVQGFGGGIYLENGSSSNKTSLNFIFAPGLSTFGLYSNTAETGGDEIVAEGQYTDITLPSIAKMQLIGFEGQDASPFWYQDYNPEDNNYNNVDGNVINHAVLKKVAVVNRYRSLVKEEGKLFIEHRIDDTRLGSIKDHYLCLALGFSMLDLTITAKGLLGGETALVHLYRQGSANNKTYDILLTKTDDNLTYASKVIANLPWGTYTIIPDNAWNWAYEPIAPMENIRLGDNPQHEIVLEMRHNSVAVQPLHYDVHKK